MKQAGVKRALLVATLASGVAGWVPAYADGQKIQLAPESGDSWKETIPSPPHVAMAQGGADVQPIVSSLRFCGAIADRDGRLSCYDDVASHNGVEVNQTDTTKPVSQWVVKENSATEDYIAGLSSGPAISDDGQKMPRPLIMYFRCHSGTPTLYFKTGGVVGKESVPVEISEGEGGVGDRIGRYSLWPSASGDAFGVWNGVAVSNMVSYLSTVGGIRLSYHLRDAPRMSARFDMSRFAQDTADIRRACRL
mgnify:CR=1 FL=1